VSRSSLLLRIELRSNPEMLCVVRNALGQLAATLGFSEPECHAVVLAVDEALTNIIRHAYLGDAEQPSRRHSAGFMCRTMVRAGMPLKSCWKIAAWP